MEKNIDHNKDFHKIKVFSSEDERLKILGELLSNYTSRKIIRFLMQQESYTNEIATKLNIRINLVIHHLKKLEELGLVEITTKPIVRKGNHHRYFRMVPGLFVIPNQNQEEIGKSGILKKIFKDGVKFSIIAFVSVVSWIMGNSHNFHEIAGEPSYSLDVDISFFFVPIVIIGSSLILIWFSRKYK